MSTTRRQDREDQEGAAHRASDSRPALGRRSLLGAVGGFALAASGLLLPERLVKEVGN